MTGYKNCTESDLTFAMYCCIGRTLKLMSLEQFFNQSTLLSTMDHCFRDCHVSTHMTLFMEMITILKNHRNSSHQYEMEECFSIDDNCKADTKFIYILCMLILTLTFAAALLGNTMVIVSILHERKLRNQPSGMFVLSLAFSDFLVAMFIIPIKLHVHSHNLFFCQSAQLCRIYIAVDNVLFVASITNLFVLTVDRYLGLQYGFGFTYSTVLTKRRVRGLIVVIWMYAVVWGIAGTVDWTDNRPSIVVTKTLECVPKNEYYVTVVFVVVFHIPIIMMIFLYARIFRIAQRHAVQISTLQKSTDSQYSKGIMPNAIKSLTARKHLRRTNTSFMHGEESELSSSTVDSNVSFLAQQSTATIEFTVLSKETRVLKSKGLTKATKTIALVCGFFLMCWLPVSVLAIGLSWSTETFRNVHPSAHVIIVDFLPVLNSTVNPFIYFMANSMYRKALRRALDHCKNVLQNYSNYQF